MSSAGFHERIHADPARLVGLRRALARWVADLGMSVDQQQDVVLAGYEAMANSAEHAYPAGAGGPLDVRAECLAGEVTLVVTDYGAWKAPDPTETFRGRGRPLITALADASATTHRPDGTTVTMSWHLDRT